MQVDGKRALSLSSIGESRRLVRGQSGGRPNTTERALRCSSAPLRFPRQNRGARCETGIPDPARDQHATLQMLLTSLVQHKSALHQH